MRFAAFLLLFVPMIAEGKPPVVSINNIGHSQIVVAEGAVKKVLNLSELVTGCAISVKSKFIRAQCTAGPPVFKLIDSGVKGARTYLLILAKAQDNCNVCKRCGASTGLALIWLKLDAHLAVEAKTSRPIRDCMAFRQIVGDGENGPDLTFKSDLLELTSLRKNVFEHMAEYDKIKYDRSRREDGLVVSVEKKPLADQ